MPGYGSGEAGEGLVDISRAKTVLICAFLILNVFLFHQLWQEEGGHLPPFLGEGDASRLEEALSEANLVLNDPLPQGRVRMAHLVVEPQHYGPEEIVEILTAGLPEGEGLTEWEAFAAGNTENGGEVFELNGLEIAFEQEGIIKIKKRADPDAEVAAALEETEAAVEKFIEEAVLLERFVFDYKQEGEEELVLHYHQEHEEVPLFAGYLRAKVGQHEWTARFFPLAPLELAEGEREVISPLAALLRFLEGYGEAPTPTAVKEMSLGYYSPEYDAQRWEIPPVWRIRLDNGEVFYINAFTGHLER